MYKAFSVLIPFVRAFILEAEESGESGEKKKAAVEAAMEAIWDELQDLFPQLEPYEFDDYRPFLGIATTGLVTLFNTLFDGVWSLVEDYVVDPIEDWVDYDLDGDGDIGGEPVTFDLKPVE